MSPLVSRQQSLDVGMSFASRFSTAVTAPGRVRAETVDEQVAQPDGCVLADISPKRLASRLGAIHWEAHDSAVAAAFEQAPRSAPRRGWLPRPPLTCGDHLLDPAPAFASAPHHQVNSDVRVEADAEARAAGSRLGLRSAAIGSREASALFITRRPLPRSRAINTT